MLPPLGPLLLLCPWLGATCQQSLFIHQVASSLLAAAWAGARAKRQFSWCLHAAMTMLFDAIDIYESDSQLANGMDVFRCEVDALLYEASYS